MMRKINFIYFFMVSIVGILSTSLCSDAMEDQNHSIIKSGENKTIWQYVGVELNRNKERLIDQTLESSAHINDTLFIRNEGFKPYAYLDGALVKLLLIHGTSNLEVGYIDLNLWCTETIRPYYDNEPKIQSILAKNKILRFAILGQITIYEKEQGKGYAREALRIYHRFLDNEIRPDFCLLAIKSRMPYAGTTYKKAGYQFTNNTLKDIFNWAKNQNIPEEESEIEFLKDTSQTLFGLDMLIKLPFMVRFIS